MDAFWQSLPWTLKAAVAVVIGLAQGVTILLIPKRTLVAWSVKPYLSPNWITFWGFSSYWIGVACFFVGSTVSWFQMIGFQLGVTGCILDIIDGKMANAMTEFGVPRSAEDIAFGKRIDPLADKGRVLPTLGIMLWFHAVALWLVIAIVGVDLVSTLMRKPFNLGGTYTRGESATWIGKVKTLIQMFGLITAVPTVLGWTRDAHVANGFFGVALALGVLSVLSRVRLHPEIDKALDRGSEYFQHKDI